MIKAPSANRGMLPTGTVNGSHGNGPRLQLLAGSRAS